MFKKVLLLGIVSGLLAGLAGLVYAKVYYTINEADFSKVVPGVRIVAASLFGGILAAIGYFVLDLKWKWRGEIVFNFLFTAISFASLFLPIAARLPRGIETPELFPGMVIPMHFFPALAWYTIKPLIIKPLVTKK